ncbi:MAG: hypothetical protein N2C14_31695 [Planctomycetales bacterium]
MDCVPLALPVLEGTPHSEHTTTNPFSTYFWGILHSLHQEPRAVVYRVGVNRVC